MWLSTCTQLTTASASTNSPRARMAGTPLKTRTQLRASLPLIRPSSYGSLSRRQAAQPQAIPTSSFSAAWARVPSRTSRRVPPLLRRSRRQSLPMALTSPNASAAQGRLNHLAMAALMTDYRAAPRITSRLPVTPRLSVPCKSSVVMWLTTTLSSSGLPRRTSRSLTMSYLHSRSMNRLPSRLRLHPLESPLSRVRSLSSVGLPEFQAVQQPSQLPSQLNALSPVRVRVWQASQRRSPSRGYSSLRVRLRELLRLQARSALTALSVPSARGWPVSQVRSAFGASSVAVQRAWPRLPGHWMSRVAYLVHLLALVVSVEVWRSAVVCPVWRLASAAFQAFSESTLDWLVY